MEVEITDETLKSVTEYSNSLANQETILRPIIRQVYRHVCMCLSNQILKSNHES